ncbi:hypothetical protein SAMN05878503_1014 [Cereibacter ovatus]|uniref:Uncharacterized protein n=1 Tax=Cereibacter ovatus TaxID=439529 RepID=A0A285CIF1_9RHOB|nr:hypothetical protein [Cereibacter ovatus]SNX67372.1 hypothetical protein SAMN05878503_1014 [Cereibacter ovatus]
MKTPFEHHQPGLTSPAVGSLAVTPSDTADLASAIRAVTIGGEGVIAWLNLRGEEQVTGTLPAGTYPLQASRILATGTTATDITGWV